MRCEMWGKPTWELHIFSPSCNHLFFRKKKISKEKLRSDFVLTSITNNANTPMRMKNHKKSLQMRVSVCVCVYVCKKSWFRKRISHKSAILTIRRAPSFSTPTLFGWYFPHYDVWAIFVCVCVWKESHELCVKRWAFDRVHKWIANRAIDKNVCYGKLTFHFLYYVTESVHASWMDIFQAKYQKDTPYFPSLSPSRYVMVYVCRVFFPLEYAHSIHTNKHIWVFIFLRGKIPNIF